MSDKVDWLEEQDFKLIICPDSASFDKDEMERLVAKGMEILALD